MAAFLSGVPLRKKTVNVQGLGAVVATELVLGERIVYERSVAAESEIRDTEPEAGKSREPAASSTALMLCLASRDADGKYLFAKVGDDGQPVIDRAVALQLDAQGSGRLIELVHAVWEVNVAVTAAALEGERKN